MKAQPAHRRVDMASFCAAQGHLQQAEALAHYARLTTHLSDEASPADPRTVDWQAQGQLRTSVGQADVPWLHLQAETTVPLTCQRCLTPVQVLLQVDRWFRFVADEATAEREDEESEEDLLAISREFDLQALVEDELLMELPAVPRHDECPVPVQLSAGDAEFEAAFEEKTNPFAALALLKGLGNGQKT